MSSGEAAYPVLKAREGTEQLKAAVQTVTTITVEIEGGSKPALVADWVTRTVFDS